MGSIILVSLPKERRVRTSGTESRPGLANIFFGRGFNLEIFLGYIFPSDN